MNSLFESSYFYRKKIHPVLTKLPFYDYWMLRRHSYLAEKGWFKSFRSGQSMDASAAPIPWFTYSAICFLDERLPGDAAVFEYGSGYGTAWWAARAKLLHAVEHRKRWKEKVAPALSGNVKVTYQELGRGYESFAAESEIDYDVIILDGRNRDRCFHYAKQSLTDRGVIIFDDSNWEKYQKTISYIRSEGFRQLPFRGMSPIEFRECETSIFYRKGNLLGI